MKGILKGFVVGILALGVFLYGCDVYVNFSNSEFFGDIKHAAPIMAQVFGIVGLVWMVVYSILSAESSTVKLIGSGLVLSLAFAANNVWTYGLSIFIVATLVTELQFLEKLAAMFTNRDKYWDFLAQQSTPQQSKQKALLEAVEDVEAEQAEKRGETPGDLAPKADTSGGIQTPVVEPVSDLADNQTVVADVFSLSQESVESAETFTHDLSQKLVKKRAENIIKFQNDALSALRRYTSALEGIKLFSQIRFSAPGVNFEVDGLLKTPSIDYVVEIKNVVTAFGVAKAQETLSKLISKYTAMIASAGERKEVRGILIVPKGVWVERSDVVDMVVLELDQKTNLLKHVGGDWQ
ncbi:hypothetical protein ACX64L_10255 [Pseudomonas monsensis]